MSDVRNNTAESRFELDVEGHIAAAYYDFKPGIITFTHTEVPEALSGRGIGSKPGSHSGTTRESYDPRASRIALLRSQSLIPTGFESGQAGASQQWFHAESERMDVR